jgi:predicted pyridoxine 5'-phosphate oxidase superfamily flavin-nucleotide-binding protein
LTETRINPRRAQANVHVNPVRTGRLQLLFKINILVAHGCVKPKLGDQVPVTNVTAVSVTAVSVTAVSVTAERPKVSVTAERPKFA